MEMEKKNVLKQDVVPSLSCPICNNLFDHPTNITECNHICESLIFIFLQEMHRGQVYSREAEACPVCNVDLGVAPFAKLKLDNCWNDLMQKFFKPKPNTVKAGTKTGSTFLNYSRKKNQSLTSIIATSSGVATPPEPLEPKKLRKRNNVLVRASLSDDLGKSLSTTDKRNHTKRIAETAITPNGKEKQNFVLTERISGEKKKNKGKEKLESFPARRKVSGRQKGKGKASSPPVFKPGMHVDMSSGGTSSQAAISAEAEKASNNKVWLSLIAARNRNLDRPILPQISSKYIRTDGNLTVSYVKKYIVKKLGLGSENEVEIWLREEAVSSTQNLHELVDWWVQTTPTAERKSGTLGGSGAGFVMVLHYSGTYRQ